ncbi:endonuclease domain-containing protein [Pseudolysinimonas sp.]|uniref:endonuclease domain-containing protein n=1 Tax=Pseudolysinimonas sp. TaxID=2680009 RepID=UPI003F8001A8
MHHTSDASRHGLATTQDLRSAGMSERAIAAAVTAGRLRRLRRGWFAGPLAEPRVASAVAAGGRVACASALAMHGVWVLREDGLHVAVRDGSHRRSERGRRIHHRTLRAEQTDGLVESPLEALEQLSHCASAMETVIAMNSALQHTLVTRSALATVFDRSRRSRWLLDHVDGRSQSGTETIARLALGRRGVRLRPQVVVPGVGRVDLLIGERLVLEIDGAAWHASPEAFEVDRRRDLELTVRGFLVVRISYRRVIDDWAGVESALLTLIGREEHRLRGRDRVARSAAIGI